MSEEDKDDVQSEETQENAEDNASQKNELDPQTLLAQKNHWKEKAKKLQSELEAKGQTEEKKETAPVESDDIKEWVKASNQGYSEDEIELAKKLKPGKLSEALQDETVRAAISGIRTQKKSKDAIPTPSSKVLIVGDKAFHDLPVTEKKAHYESSIQKAIEKGRKSARTLT